MRDLISLLEFELDQGPKEIRHLLAGLYLFQAELRKSYIEGLLRYSEYFHFPDAIEWWEAQLEACDESLARAEYFCAPLLSHEELDDSYCYQLHEACWMLPAIFRAQLHDIQQIFGMIRGEFTYEDAGIDSTSAEIWEKLGQGPRSAGYWNAYGIDVEEAAEWMSCGFAEPSKAGAWSSRGFDALEARIWSDSGYSAKQARFYRSAGCHHPDEADEAQAFAN